MSPTVSYLDSCQLILPRHEAEAFSQNRDGDGMELRVTARGLTHF